MNDDMCCGETAGAAQPNVPGDNDGLAMATFNGVVAAPYLRQRDDIMPADDRGPENAELVVALRTALPDPLRLPRIGAVGQACRVATND